MKSTQSTGAPLPVVSTSQHPRKQIHGGSTKTRALLEEISKMIDTTNDKCLVVSQWTRLVFTDLVISDVIFFPKINLFLLLDTWR